VERYAVDTMLWIATNLEELLFVACLVFSFVFGYLVCFVHERIEEALFS
jgi:hypothetical protein